MCAGPQDIDAASIIPGAPDCPLHVPIMSGYLWPGRAAAGCAGSWHMTAGRRPVRSTTPTGRPLLVRSPSASKSPGCRRPRCRDSARSTPAWSARAAVARRAGSSFACRSTLPKCASSSACCDWRDQAQVPQPSSRGSERIAAFLDEVSRECGWEKTKFSDLRLACLIHFCTASRVAAVISN